MAAMRSLPHKAKLNEAEQDATRFKSCQTNGLRGFGDRSSKVKGLQKTRLLRFKKQFRDLGFDLGGRKEHRFHIWE